MPDVEIKSKRDTTPGDRDSVLPSEPAFRDDVSIPEPATRDRTGPHLRILPVLITLAAVGLAVPLAWAMWDAYMGAPWTRDGTVRAYVVTIAPEVAGRSSSCRSPTTSSCARATC